MINSFRSFKKFYEQVGERYPEEEEVFATLRGRLRKKFVLDYLDKHQGSLLDIGCNRAMYLSAYGNGPRFGIDLSFEVLRRARRIRTDLMVADAERLYCFKPASFDHVLCSEVLEHCLHPQRIFNGIAHVLKPGGTALLTTPNYKGKRPQWIGMGTLSHYGVQSMDSGLYYHSAFRPEELKTLAAGSGLAAVQTGTLEKEVKYAAKIPAFFLLSGRLVNRLFQSRRFDLYNEKLNTLLTWWIYEFCRISHLDRLLCRLVREGVRSFIIMTKERS